MVIGVVIGIVPLIYLYLRAKFRELDSEEQNKTLWWLSIVVLSILGYIAFTVSTHEYFWTAILSVGCGYGLTYLMFYLENQTYHLTSIKGYHAVIKQELIIFLVLLVLCIVLVIYKNI